jgi:hypothetical protein
VVFDAANFGALPVLAGRDRIVAAQAAVMGAGTVAELAVPALAGAALAVVAAAPLLAVDALSFVVSALLLGAITRPLWDPATAGAPRRLAAEIRDGLTYLWRQRVVRATVLVVGAQAVTGGVFIGQLVPWADQALGVPPGDGRLGLLFAAWELGGLVASVLLPWAVRRVAEPRVLLSCLPLSTLGALTCALSSHWLLAALVITGWGAAYSMVVLAGITQRRSSPLTGCRAGSTPPGGCCRSELAGRWARWPAVWSPRRTGHGQPCSARSPPCWRARSLPGCHRSARLPAITRPGRRRRSAAQLSWSAAACSAGVSGAGCSAATQAGANSLR